MKMFITLEPHGIFDQALHKNACKCYQTIGIGTCNILFGGIGFAEHHFSGLWSGSKILITLELHGKFESNFAYLCI